MEKWHVVSSFMQLVGQNVVSSVFLPMQRNLLLRLIASNWADGDGGESLGRPMSFSGLNLRGRISREKIPSMDGHISRGSATSHPKGRNPRPLTFGGPPTVAPKCFWLYVWPIRMRTRDLFVIAKIILLQYVISTRRGVSMWGLTAVNTGHFGDEFFSNQSFAQVLIT